MSIVKGSCEGKGFQWWTGQRFRWERKAQTGQKMREVYDCQEVDEYKTGGKVQLLRDTYTWYCTAYGKQSPNKDVIENGPEAHRRYYVTLHHTRMVWSRRHRGSMWVIIEHSGRVLSRAWRLLDYSTWVRLWFCGAMVQWIRGQGFRRERKAQTGQEMRGELRLSRGRRIQDWR